MRAGTTNRLRARRWKAPATAVLFITCCLAVSFWKGAAPLQVASAAATPPDGILISIDIAELSNLGHTVLSSFKSLGPVHGTAVLSVRGETLRLDDIEILAEGEGADLSIEGSMANLYSRDGLTLNFRFQVPSAGWFSGGQQSAGSRPLTLSGQIVSTQEGLLLRDMLLQAPGSRATGTLDVNLSGERPRVTGRISASELDLGDFVDPRSAPVESSERVIPDTQLVINSTEVGFEADVVLEATQLRVQGLELEQAVTELKFAPEGIHVTSSGRVAGGRYEGTIARASGLEEPGAILHLRMNGVSADLVARQAGFVDYLDGGLTNVAVDVRGRGGSLRDIMASLDGKVRIDIGEHRILNRRLRDAQVGVLESLVGLFTPSEDTDAATHVSCSAVRFHIADGVADTRQGLVLLTQKLVVAGTGVIDLRDESLSFLLNIEPRKGWRLSTASLADGATVTGSLSAPSVGMSAAGVARSAIRLTGGLATGGLSLLAGATLRAAAEGGDACTRALDAPREQTGLVEGAAGAVKEGARALKEGLESLLGR